MYPRLISSIQKAFDMEFVPIPLVGEISVINDWQNTTMETVNNRLIEACDTNKCNNIGVLCGEISKFIVVGVNLKDQGVELWNSFFKTHDPIDTFTVQTSTGFHYYFRYDERTKGLKNMTRAIDGKGIDVRTNGEQVVFVGSINPETLLEYTIFYEPATNKIAEIPDWLLNMLKTGRSVEPKIKTTSLPRTQSPPQKSVQQQDKQDLHQVPPGNTKENAVVCTGYMGYQIADLYTLYIDRKDTGLAQYYTKMMGSTCICVNYDKEKFYFWKHDKLLWEHGSRKMLYVSISNVLTDMLEVSSKYYQVILKKIDKEAKDAGEQIAKMKYILQCIVKAQNRVGNVAGMNSIINIASYLLCNPTFSDDMNKMFGLLPVRDGLVINLQTGEVRQRTREDKFSFECPVTYNPDADMTDITTYFDEISMGNKKGFTSDHYWLLYNWRK